MLPLNLQSVQNFVFVADFRKKESHYLKLQIFTFLHSLLKHRHIFFIKNIYIVLKYIFS